MYHENYTNTLFTVSIYAYSAWVALRGRGDGMGRDGQTPVSMDTCVLIVHCSIQREIVLSDLTCCCARKHQWTGDEYAGEDEPLHTWKTKYLEKNQLIRH